MAQRDLGKIDDVRERVKAIETRCPLREEVVNNQFDFIAKKLDETIGYVKEKNDKIDEMYAIVNNGLKDTVKANKDAIEKHEQRMLDTEKMLIAHTAAMQSIKPTESEHKVIRVASTLKEWTIKIGIPFILILIASVLVRLQLLDPDVFDTITKLFF